MAGRMKRRLFSLLSGLSLLLFVAAAGMWARSGYHCDSLTVTAGGVERSLYSQWHSLYYAFASDAVGGRGMAYGHASIDRAPGTSPLGDFGFTSNGRVYVSVPWLFFAVIGVPAPVLWAVRSGVPRWTRHVPWVAINAFAVAEAVSSGNFGEIFICSLLLAPVGAVVLLFVVDVGRHAWKYAGTPRYRYGHCPTCGYDLRATPGRCPECGEVPQKAPA